MTDSPVRAHLRAAKRAFDNYGDPMPGGYLSTARAHIERALDEINDRIDSGQSDTPKLVTGSVFRMMPNGSIGIICHPDGTPNQRYVPVRPDGASERQKYRVLYAAPVAPLTLGEAIPDSDRLSGAKPGTILRWNTSETVRMLSADGLWYTPGSTYGVESSGLSFRTTQPTVIALPEENKS